MVKARGSTKDMMKQISNIGIIKYGYEVSGDYDACLVVEGPTLEDIDGKIDRIRALRTVRDTKSFIVLRKW
ncbi:Lrp/AsnC ligand binding domain-containing protein [Candidatus Micrarchaeota archaeon]|nr:Lrp/AsnC ligand binding domain-containing protein [Candidatus Micrarchaeota archaeon]